MKNQLLLPLNLQFFADGIDNFDFETFDANWNQQLEIEGQEEIEEQSDDLDHDDELETELEDDDEQDEVPDDVNSDDEQKRNAAFADMRRERDQYKQQQEWIKQLAAESGLSVEELKARYEEQQLEKQAQEKGVPVDVLKRLTSLEEENKSMKEQTQSEKFNASVIATLEKYNSDDEGFDRTVEYAHENGIFDAVANGLIPFESAFRLAHMDDMVNEAKQNAIQENLSQKKKRQQEAAPPNGGTTPPAGDDIDELVSNDVKNILENGGF